MADAANIFNNTILIPYHDSLVGSNPLPTYNPAEKIEALQNTAPNEGKNLAAYIKLNDGNSVRMIAVQSISGFGMERTNEQKVGTTPDYVINLPGPVKYTDISIKHVFTRDKFFLDWVTNGVLQGGAARADLEIHIAPQMKKELVFTLYDAFPVGWKLDNLDAGNAESVLMEEIILTFSQVSFKTAAVSG